MEFFRHFWSDTLAGTGNQSWFAPDSGETLCVGRSYYRVFAGGQVRYSFLFTNLVDSTYADGSHSHANLVCDEWELCSLKCGVCDTVTGGEAVPVTLTFDGKLGRHVAPGEFFSTDPISLNVLPGQYLCLEIAFRGTVVPYMEEAIIPVFRQRNGAFVPDKRVPLAAMVGSDREAGLRVAFLGDSITEGIGTPDNAYTHWNARIAEKLGTSCAYWNLGIGYGRASDAASGGSWLFKARQAELVNVCFGVNDLLQRCRPDEVKENLLRVVTLLRDAGCRVGLFTVPPFDMTGAYETGWREVCRYIREELAPMVEYVFDVVPIWGQDAPRDNLARYGGHPDKQGCEALAEAFVRQVHW